MSKGPFMREAQFIDNPSVSLRLPPSLAQGGQEFLGSLVDSTRGKRAIYCSNEAQRSVKKGAVTDR